jgi:hypothetical protein
MPIRAITGMNHSLGDHEIFMLDPKMNPCLPVMCALELSTDEAAEFESDRFSVAESRG